MDTADVQWAAGFFQGEGWFGLAHQKRKTVDDYIFPDLKITQYSDRTPLDKFVEIFGIGKVYGPTKGRGEDEVYQYAASGNQALVVVEHLRAYLLGKKKVQVDTALEQYRLYRDKPRVVSRRKTHCVNGHEFNDQNTYVRGDGVQICRPCHNAAKRRYRNKN